MSEHDGGSLEAQFDKDLARFFEVLKREPGCHTNGFSYVIAHRTAFSGLVRCP
jgi:hypothetical protein